MTDEALRTRRGQRGEERSEGAREDDAAGAGGPSEPRVQPGGIEVAGPVQRIAHGHELTGGQHRDQVQPGLRATGQQQPAVTDDVVPGQVSDVRADPHAFGTW